MANDLEKKIIKQVEYYFGDYNLPKDKFLLEHVKKDAWVPLEVLLTFKRLANLTKDPEVVVAALEKSDSGLLAISEDRQKIRRVPEKPIPQLNEDRLKELVTRTAYAKGFPVNESLDDIMSFLEEHGPIESCTKRSYIDKATNEHIFKGSCFIIFNDVETCKKFVEAKSIKYKETELIRKFQKDYIESKREEIKLRKEDRQKRKEEKEEAIQATIKPMPKGAIFFFSGVTNKTLTREEIKQQVLEIAGESPAYIEFNKGDTEGYVRMSNENAAVEFHKKLTDSKLKVGDEELKVEVLEGDKEEEYLQKAKSVMGLKRKAANKGGKKNFKRKGQDQDGHKAKKAKA